MSSDWWFKRPHPYDADPDWQHDAACRDMNPDLFFPARGTAVKHVRTAKAVCAECPIRIKCLDYALYHGERCGIWGGLTERERRTLSSQLRRTNEHPQQIHDYAYRKNTP